MSAPATGPATSCREYLGRSVGYCPEAPDGGRFCAPHQAARDAFLAAAGTHQAPRLALTPGGRA